MKRIVPLTLLGCVACSGSNDSTDDAAPTPSALVALGRVEQGALAQQATLYGIVEAGPGGKITLTAPVEAMVARVTSPVGTRVAAGDVVVQLALAPNTRLDIVKASTDARAADAAYARVQRLRKDGLVGDAEVETARAAAASADATRASLTGRARALTLRANAAGFVEAIAFNPGDLVQAGAPVATLSRLNDQRAHFGVDPATARALRPGVPIRIGGSTGRARFTVPIASVDPVVDPQTRLASVFAKLPTSAGLGIGETLTGTAAVGGGGDALTIPYTALLDDGGQPFVFVVDSGVAHRHDVTIGSTEGNRVAITRGIVRSELVVTQGGTAVEDGMKVRIK